MPVTSTLGRLRQEDCKFEAILSDTVSPYLKSGMGSSLCVHLGHQLREAASDVVWWKKQLGGVHTLNVLRRGEAGEE